MSAYEDPDWFTSPRGLDKLTVRIIKDRDRAGAAKTRRKVLAKERRHQKFSEELADRAMVNAEMKFLLLESLRALKTPRHP